ncbi:glycine oxidase ThiO [Mangrovihabitans endophyticus]|uniref:glycine oxidase n=1 Tax=Mangrovihabitans endophyticus TaxID=1751298 RepID=A0A8J3BYK2_9ACTN|nr:glycine oxidase ThiO [Mangrovihabitans endophyticus]GGK92689.1 glycine oxidase ThiO [Mangrovihabitans endophyticus]
MNVSIIGGGIIGLSVAWRLIDRGARVTVHDPGGVDGAWHVAAGMLAPGRESGFEDPALITLLDESARRWPDFAGRLGTDVGFDTSGTLGVALTADDAAEAGRFWPAERLGPTALREREPALSPRLRAGVHLPADRQVDPRRVVAALRARLRGHLVPECVGKATDLDADVVVVAAGCGTADLTGLPVRPVKGQLLRLRGEPGLLRHVIDGAADGRHVYLVPRADGEVVVGATQEELGDRTVTAGGVLDLLRAAVDLVPALADFALAETTAGHRPGTPDNMPLLGTLPRYARGGAAGPRIVVAAGHHRNGILLAPITADLIADLVLTGRADPSLAPFDPGRFECD